MAESGHAIYSTEAMCHSTKMNGVSGFEKAGQKNPSIHTSELQEITWSQHKLVRLKCLQ